MPATAIINMRAVTGGQIPRSFHCLMHPLFFSQLSAADPRLAAALHDSRGMLPFSISPVIGPTAKGKIIQNETYWVRICLLQPNLEDAFLSILEKGSWAAPISLGDFSFQMEDIILGKQEGNPWSGRENYEEMLSHNSIPDKISLRLASPMSFKRGDLHYPLPEPGLLFGNLAVRWNLFSPDKLPSQLNYHNVSYAYFDIHTEPYSLRKGGTILGAVGRLTFIFQGEEWERRYYYTLLRFAFYAGIGVKTAQGMGMCRIV